MPDGGSIQSSLEPTAPFLKWAGGKRWIARFVAELLCNSRRHFEPFAGSAACFFATRTRQAYLSDDNEELINCYRVVRDNGKGLIDCLKSLKIDRRTFNRIRSASPPSRLERAVRFIYLNRTAFNGLYRVNREGHFNVPFGCKPTTMLCDASSLLACASRLQGVRLEASDFSVALKHVRAADAVYIDPPYTVKHNDNAFRRYNERIFSWDDQVRLAGIAGTLATRGARLVITNALHPDVTAMYSRRHFLGLRIVRASNMAASSLKRGSCEELLLVSHATASSLRSVKQLASDLLPRGASAVRLPAG
jgi:DNA adenine methylase